MTQLSAEPDPAACGDACYPSIYPLLEGHITFANLNPTFVLIESGSHTFCSTDVTSIDNIFKVAEMYGEETAIAVDFTAVFCNGSGLNCATDVVVNNQRMTSTGVECGGVPITDDETKFAGLEKKPNEYCAVEASVNIPCVTTTEMSSGRQSSVAKSASDVCVGRSGPSIFGGKGAVDITLLADRNSRDHAKPKITGNQKYANDSTDITPTSIELVNQGDAAFREIDQSRLHIQPAGFNSMSSVDSGFQLTPPKCDEFRPSTHATGQQDQNSSRTLMSSADDCKGNYTITSTAFDNPEDKLHEENIVRNASTTFSFPHEEVGAVKSFSNTSFGFARSSMLKKPHDVASEKKYPNGVVGYDSDTDEERTTVKHNSTAQRTEMTAFPHDDHLIADELGCTVSLPNRFRLDVEHTERVSRAAIRDEHYVDHWVEHTTKNLEADGTNPNLMPIGNISTDTDVTETSDEIGLGASAGKIPTRRTKLPDTTGRQGPNDYTDEELHALLNAWYKIPAMFNKEDYPFPCGGFVCTQTDKSQMLVFTRRLGAVRRNEDPGRNGCQYAYFMVTGPGNYRAWEYDTKPHPSFKSTKYADSTHIECKGYALMAPGNRDDSESTWYAWNDHTGFMRCQSSSARTMKKKYMAWEPTLQMIMFDASYNHKQDNWTVKTISHMDINVCHKNNFWPQQAYYIDDLTPIDLDLTAHDSKFFSKELNSNVYVMKAHVQFPPTGNPMSAKYGAVITTVWNNHGLDREYRALVVAPYKTWDDPKKERWVAVSTALFVQHFDKTTEKERVSPSICVEARSARDADITINSETSLDGEQEDGIVRDVGEEW